MATRQLLAELWRLRGAPMASPAWSRWAASTRRPACRPARPSISRRLFRRRRRRRRRPHAGPGHVQAAWASPSSSRTSRAPAPTSRSSTSSTPSPTATRCCWPPTRWRPTWRCTSRAVRRREGPRAVAAGRPRAGGHRRQPQRAVHHHRPDRRPPRPSRTAWPTPRRATARRRTWPPTVRARRRHRPAARAVPRRRQAITDVIGGQVPLLAMNALEVKPQAKRQAARCWRC
jgi:hypothetical protein